MNEKNGGPAFPNTVKITDEDFAELRGMTLRDYFAAKAMQEMIDSARYTGLIGANGAQFDYARRAYEMADAMLRAREE